MSFDNLQIIRLAPSGEVRRKIDCLAGHITALRSFDRQELLLFRAAMQGKPTKVHFSLLLDDRPYDPLGHFYMGLDETLLASEQGERTVIKTEVRLLAECRR